MSDMTSYRAGSGSEGAQKPLADQALAFGQEVKEKAVELGTTVAQTAKEQATELTNAARDIASDTATKVQDALGQQKAAGAEYLSDVAKAVHRAANEFDQRVPPAARYIRLAAAQLESVAGAVRDREVNEWVHEVQDFARRQPGIFFGGAVIFGFAALRFFKSASEDVSHPAPAPTPSGPSTP
jgi:hypothetical protein